MTSRRRDASVVECDRCHATFKTPQGLAGHRRFRHGDPAREAAIDRAQAQRLQMLDAFALDPSLPPTMALLIARLRRRYGDNKGRAGPTTCVVCDAACKTPQGLAGHMRHRHGAGQRAASDYRKSGELLRYLQTYQPPEAVAEAIWEKVLRLSGFRW